MSSATQPEKPEDKKDVKKTLVSLEEDDEFEDFPVEDWKDSEQDVQVGVSSGKGHLWEEQWDDDDAEEDFAQQLRTVMNKPVGQ